MKNKLMCYFVFSIFVSLGTLAAEELPLQMATAIEIETTFSPAVLTDTNFKKTISEGYSVVYFYAPWCGPCRAYGPIFANVASGMQSSLLELTFYKVNIDSSPKATAAQKVTHIPTTIIFYKGQELTRSNGFLSANELSELVMKHCLD